MRHDPDLIEHLLQLAVELADAAAAETLPLFRRAFAMWPDWRVLVPRLPEAGLLPDDTELIARILAVGESR